MEEDEDVDIIGNYDGFMSKNDRDISQLGSGQLLSCDYTVHPKWLNENIDGENYWTASVPKNESFEDNVEVLQSEEVVIEEPEPVPNITELVWAGEVANQDNLVFEEDIPASIEEVVTNQDDGNSDTCSTSSKNPETVNEVQGEIYNFEPAAFETHPPVENSHYIGPTNSRSILKVNIKTSNDENLEGVQNKIEITTLRPTSKFKQTLNINQSLLMKTKKLAMSKISIKREESPKQHKTATKFKQTVKIRQNNLENSKFKIFTKKLRTARAGKMRKNPGKGKRCKDMFMHDANITISHESEVPQVTGDIGENAIVKLNNYNSESDIDVDIETDPQAENTLLGKNLPHIEVASKPAPKITEYKKYDSLINPKESENPQPPVKSVVIEEYGGLNPELVIQLKSVEIPLEQLIINSDEISELEKFFHSEFFKNRTTKTPEQYLRIRNHILSVWASCKPNYVSKTAVRNGLKHGGDVNCISRIHRLLEQMGAINFGHQNKQFEFVRPFENFISLFVNTPRTRTNSNNASSIATATTERRQRIRNNAFSIAPSRSEDLDKDVNYTIEHITGKSIFGSLGINAESRSSSRFRSIARKNTATELDLIKCLKFSKDNLAPFKISLTLSTLLCLQLHSLSSDYEVMGFLGGHRSKSVGRNKISLTRYKPCRTSTQSGIMCEMCPVSQVEQSSSLGAEGYDLLAWFHSHPLFPANPSRTDLRTQKEMQLQFSSEENRPFVGLILSNLHMDLKCIYIMPENSNSNLRSDNCLPYEIDIDIVKDCTNIKSYIRDVLCVIEETCDSLEEVIKKFKTASNSIVRQFGFKTDEFYLDIF